MRDLRVQDEKAGWEPKQIDTLEEAVATLDRFGHPDDPLVEFAREEISCCSCGHSSLHRVRVAVRAAIYRSEVLGSDSFALK